MSNPLVSRDRIDQEVVSALATTLRTEASEIASQFGCPASNFWGGR